MGISVHDWHYSTLGPWTATVVVVYGCVSWPSFSYTAFGLNIWE